MPKENYPEIVEGDEAEKLAALDLSSHLVSIIVPAKDEASSIGNILIKIDQTMAVYPHETIVVDDGSTDETGEIVRSHSAIVVSHEQNQGKGAAMKTGVGQASGDIIVFLDSDGAHDPRDIPGVITPILEGKTDLVIGSRSLPESRVSISPLARKLSNNLASFTISAIISFALPLITLFQHTPKYIKITDGTSGFRAIKKESWQKLNLISQGFEIETEMIYEAARNRLTIGEVPIGCNWNSNFSRLSVLRDGWKTLKLLVKKVGDDIGRR
ncbi:glycosyltransferase family 2 protein [Chloroflexota bacterium]